jgi:hypothetical protein
MVLLVLKPPPPQQGVMQSLEERLRLLKAQASSSSFGGDITRYSSLSLALLEVSLWLCMEESECGLVVPHTSTQQHAPASAGLFQEAGAGASSRQSV